MKRFLFIVLAVLLNISLFSIAVYADMGPKPSIEVIASNMPDEICYMDLLINYPDDEYQNIDDLSKYDEGMINILKGYMEEGWRPAMVTGTIVPLFGDIICDVQNGISHMKYSYVGVPDQFKIIVVTKSNQVVVSNVVKRKAFQSTVFFDFETGKAYEESVSSSYILQFIITFLSTLIIELLILFIFGFSFKKNYKPFILINLLTQASLTAVVFINMVSNGTLAALISYFLLEIGIIIVEVILFNRFLHEHTKLRRTLYAITANVVSFLVGVMLLQLN